jgi:branched-chain amino acid transport system permease protein
LLVTAALLLIAMPVMPQWLMFLFTLALAKGLVVLGLVLLMRTGLVSFGQGLYYCLGAYAAALLDHALGIHDAALMLLAALIVPVVVALVLGLLLASYRGIFFAMLSMAFSMIVFGLLIKTSALGSSDGFNVATRSVFGVAIPGGYNGHVFLAATVVLSVIAITALHRFLNSHRGLLSAAVRDNELRVEYLGASVRNVVHLNYVIAAALGGVGGGLTALAVGHIDPDMAYWTTSGEFVFVAVLSGTGNVLAPFFGSVIFEAIRTLANQYAPNVWQLTLGVAMLAIIMFLPDGLWALFRRRTRAA